jgi:hypothetical protein
MAEPGADSKKESFRVFVRFRPCTTASPNIKVVKRFGQQRTVHAKHLEFLLDWVWDIHDGQEEVYDRGISERVDWVLQGFNSTIVAYGQTGSGKTCVAIAPLPSSPRACTQSLACTTSPVHKRWVQAHDVWSGRGAH